MEFTYFKMSCIFDEINLLISLDQDYVNGYNFSFGKISVDISFENIPCFSEYSMELKEYDLCNSAHFHEQSNIQIKIKEKTIFMDYYNNHNHILEKSNIKERSLIKEINAEISLTGTHWLNFVITTEELTHSILLYFPISTEKGINMDELNLKEFFFKQPIKINGPALVSSLFCLYSTLTKEHQKKQLTRRIIIEPNLNLCHKFKHIINRMLNYSGKHND